MALKNCIVTGANQGIGYEIAKAIAQRPGTRTVLAARNEERGRAALVKMQEELAAAGAAEAAQRLEYQQLDIADAASVQRFAAWASQELQSVDVLVNNAGFAYHGDVFGVAEAETTIGINYRGTAAVCEALKGLVRDGTGRIVNVCSTAGKLGIVRDAELRARFERAASMAEVDELADAFIDAIRRGKHSQEGWPTSMYGISKLCEATYTRVLAAELAGRHIMVNALCPGYCSTNMSSWRGTKPAAEGADTPVWLAFLPDSQFVTGKFFRDRQEQPF